MNKKGILLLCIIVLWILPRTVILQSDAFFETIIDVSQYTGATHSEQIQAALNDVPPSGAIVVVPEGVWQVTNLTGVSNIVFTGRQGTVLQLITQAPVITFNDKHNFVVQNFTIDGRNIDGGSAIKVIGNSAHFTIRNNFFKDVNKTAVSIELADVGQVISDFVITNNTFTNCQYATIRVFGVATKRDIRRFQITYNKLTDAIHNGKIAVAFAEDGLISNNEILNTEHGIATRSVSSITIENNIIKNIKERGIYLGTNVGDTGSDNLTIRGNTITYSRIGLSRWYGSQTHKNILIIANAIFNNTQLDIRADFPATFINNTITSKEKLEILNTGAKFVDTKNINGQPIWPSDVNNDLKIDIKDISIVARAIGSTIENTYWNFDADVIKDGKIDLKDLSYVAVNFGQI